MNLLHSNISRINSYPNSGLAPVVDPTPGDIKIEKRFSKNEPYETVVTKYTKTMENF